MHESIKIAMHNAGGLFGGPDEVVNRIAASPTKVAALAVLRQSLRTTEKTADMGSMLARAFGGAALGGAVGAGGGALAAHHRGEDPRAAAMKGGLGGAIIGGGLGGLSAGGPKGLNEKALGAGALGLGGFGAKKLMGALTGDSEAKEQRDREVGRFDAMQEIKAKQRVMLQPMHQQAFQAAQQDDVVSRADPQMIQSAFDTMQRFAPNLAADPNAVRSFLRESATWGTGPSYAMLKNLTDAESSVARAGGAI